MIKKLLFIILISLSAESLFAQDIFSVVGLQGEMQIKGDEGRTLNSDNFFSLSEEGKVRFATLTGKEQFELTENSLLLLADEKRKTIRQIEGPVTITAKEIKGKKSKNPKISDSSLFDFEDYFLQQYDTIDLIESNHTECLRCAYYPTYGIDITPAPDTYLKPESDEIEFQWFSYRDAKEYELIVRNVYDEVLFRENVKDTSIILPIQTYLKDSENSMIFWRVKAKHRKFTYKDFQSIRLADAKKIKTLERDLKKANATSPEGFIKQLTWARIHEKHQFYRDALLMYKRIAEEYPDLITAQVINLRARHYFRVLNTKETKQLLVRAWGMAGK